MMTKLEQAARQVVANGVQGTYAKYYSVPPADFEALREALADQADEIDWIETNKALAKEIIELKKQAEQEPVARVTGYHGGRCVVEPLNRSLVLPIDMALYAEPVQQVARADLKTAFKEGFERAADLYAPNDGQEPYAYEVWDVQDQSFTMIYATQLKEFHWIEPENIARVLYTAPVQQAEQRIPSHVHIIKQMEIIPEQDQVHVENIYKRGNKYFAWIGGDYVQIYTHPVRTKDLTDDDLRICFKSTNTSEPLAEGWPGLERFARAVIAADREKNK